MPRIEKQLFETEMEEASEFTHLFGLPPAIESFGGCRFLDKSGVSDVLIGRGANDTPSKGDPVP